MNIGLKGDSSMYGKLGKLYSSHNCFQHILRNVNDHSQLFFMSKLICTQSEIILSFLKILFLF